MYFSFPAMKKIKSALISVFNKDGIDEICNHLSSKNVIIYSTGGTYNYISSLGIPVEKVEELTSYPSILNGRVKTLHPKVFGGILKTNSESDIKDSIKYDIPNIDLVIVDLYPFEDTVKDSKSHEEIIEKIDIGGVSLIRAAAKNYENVTCVSSSSQYDNLIKLIKGNCSTDMSLRKSLAIEAFEKSSTYDSRIFAYLNQESNNNISEVRELRYGENPHQNGIFYGDFNKMFNQLNGKELSYNNLLDVDAAVNLILEFNNEIPTFAILKHNNACGLASRNSLFQAYKDALAGDPVSAFGGVLISNKKIDVQTAEEINKLFCEVVIAPSYEESSLEILKSKKNRIILLLKDSSLSNHQLRTCLNGVLKQDKDNITDTKSNLTNCTVKSPSESELNDLIFASKICKHTKSNTIVLAKNLQLISSGTGQTSRVDALKQAIEKSKNFKFDLNGSVMASDAFFPFPDCVEIAHKSGVSSVIQPGGSIKDNLSIDYCNENNISMVLTGIRHFKH